MRRYSLYLTIFIILIILVATSFTLIYFTETRHRKDLLETAITEKIQLAAAINNTIATPFWSYGIALIPELEKGFLGGMAEFKDVRYIRIVKRDGSIYQSSLKEEWAKTIVDSDIERVLTTKKTIVKDEIFGGEKIKTIIFPGYGEKIIWIGFTLKSIEEATKGILIRDIIIAFGGSILTILIIFLILRTVVDPIKKMTFVCQEVRKGNLDVIVPVISKTEIGELADTFNKMIKDLRESYAALEEAKTALEIKVVARTKELKELAESLEDQVKERTKELQLRIEELEKFRELTIGRELKMIELKKEIEKLKEA
jgi:methyl-accepting chemotaxis protein